ncbi:MAG TPA: hypothetical protein VF244_02150 [Acidimicrobiales bacterium]
MTTKASRTLILLAGMAWLVIGGGGVMEAMRGGEENWELHYLVFSTALLLAAVASVAVAVQATSGGGGGGRPRLRIGGLAVCGLGCLACVVAWALPLWMGLLGIGFALLAVASSSRPRRALTILAIGQLGAIAVLIAGIEAQIGRVDEYGDYPAAGGLALVFLAAVTLVGLYQLSRATAVTVDEPRPMRVA